MPEVKYLQGSPEWLTWRKGKLSASKAPIIMGLSPYQTAFELFEEELGLRDPKKMSPHMQRGLDVEDEARDWLWQHLRIEFKPTCWEHVNPLYISSLDGMSADQSHIVEIKNNNKEFHEMANNENIVPMHYAQCQHHMFCTGLDICNYLSWRKDDPILVNVKRDQAFIDDMIPKLQEFKRMCDDLVPPPLTDRDYVDVSDDYGLHELIRQYHHRATEAKSYSKLADEVKEEIKERVGNRNAKGKGFKLTKYPSRAIIDYDRLIADHCPQVDLKAYTKPTTYAYRITMES